MGFSYRLSTLFPSRRGRLCAVAAALLILVIVLILLTTRITIRGALEGIYLLEGGPGALFEIKDTILLGDYERVIIKVELGGLFSGRRSKEDGVRNVPEFRYSWNDDEGQGYIKSFFPDGAKMMISFGRFLDSQGQAPQGVFVGGGPIMNTKRVK